MIQFFRQIRKRLLTENKVSRYLLYAIGEIILVVIGILIALQINNWNEDRHRRFLEIKFYETLKSQLADDRERILGNRLFNQDDLTRFYQGLEISASNDQTKLDTLVVIASRMTNYSDFNRQGNIYETTVNSGDIKLLSNPEITAGIRDLEEAYFYANRMENIHYEVILGYVAPYLNTTLNYRLQKAENAAGLFEFEFQNLFSALIDIMEEKEEVYAHTMNLLDELTERIDEELKFQ